MTGGTALPRLERVLAVVAHPDDESFGLGALLDTFVRGGAAASVLCFTHGEASTLHGRPGELADVRAAELTSAAEVLGVTSTTLLDHPDSALASVAVADLATDIADAAARVAPGHLLTFDIGGVTGHPDHIRATEAALEAAAALGIPVLGWAVPDEVATQLNGEFGTAFAGRRADEIDWTVPVDRSRQRKAIAAHASQSADNPVLHRRLQLLGDTEYLRSLG
ncbi:MAG TPA: PIG-L deacetylase family protein [Amycolatopsis sp.]|uniref:PIG-L deacetylase family protein n=1 Tax=Amycolatopsis nalaikhensis TaxID=715472 RepID=A0ABY8XE14_9PSEU|nr:PIG-L deacetylase family protein [Amycolatopsis sp. 2-2]WIV53852.1 PIG-L deacetylase family protein [Amycolatopsis sp. 2-2]HWD02720.1 PIG-L deacetylase family protein [Amycolatopsis sp.]